MELDISHSPFPSLPLLLHELDGTFPSSEESTPADSPMFYEYGEPSRLSEVKPVFHLSTNDTYKVWWDGSFRDREVDLSDFACQDSKQETENWKAVEMEIDAMPHYSPCIQRSHHEATTQWPMRDNAVSCSVAASGARASVSGSQPSQAFVGVGWCENSLEDDVFGPVSKSPSAASFEGFHLQDGSSYSLAGSQSHNYHYNSGSSPPYHSPVSTQSTSVLPSVTIPSPCSSPSSLASTSSYSSLALTSLSSCPPAPPTPVLLPDLCQPRPARPIPIIPLSKLATACEKAYLPSSPKSSSSLPKSRRFFDESESSDLLTSKCGTRYSLFPVGQISHDTSRFQYTGESKSNSTYPYLNSWSGHSR